MVPSPFYVWLVVPISGLVTDWTFKPPLIFESAGARVESALGLCVVGSDLGQIPESIGRELFPLVGGVGHGDGVAEIDVRSLTGIVGMADHGGAAKGAVPGGG